MEEYMREALKEAKKAFDLQEVPIGCVIVKEDQIIARAHNLVETNRSALEHAEMRAMKQAADYLQTWRLEGCTMYVTLEPCAMCSGALIHSRLDTLVYALKDEKRGCCGSLYSLVSDPRFNHTLNVVGNVLQEESLELLQTFFRQLRQKRI